MAVNRDIPEASDYMEEEFDERPARKTSRRKYDEDDERPARKTARRKYDDDDDEDDVSRAVYGDPDVDEEDERPARKPKRRPEPVEDDEEEEDPDELPERSSVVQRGWAAARKAVEDSSDFADDFRFEEDPQIVKFLDDEPAVFRQHWLNEKPGKKSYVCLEDDCPLCEELGDNPSYRFAFSIVNLSVEGNPTQLLLAGVRLATMLDKLNAHKRQGPLSREFWSLSKTGEKRNTQHQVQLVKERDLLDDYDIDPDEVAEVISKREPLDMSKAIHQPTRAELLSIVDELS